MLIIDRAGVLVLLHLNRRHLESGHQLQPIPHWVTQHGDGFDISGDDTLERETFLAVNGDDVFVATDLVEMVDALKGANAVGVSAEGVSHLLGTGFIPLPMTIFDGVLRVGAGDTAHLTSEKGLHQVTIASDYPWMPERSRQDETLSTKRIHELIVASLERRLGQCDRQGLLMLSSGKDSLSLAVGLADLGYDIPCITYRSSEDDTEHEFAAAFCNRLGLRHETIEMPHDPQTVRRHVTQFFKTAVSPSGDHATIPYIVAVAESGVATGAIIDGGGNDGYLGYIPSRRRRKKRLFRVRGRWLQEAVSRATRIDSRVNYLARGRSAGAWPGRNMRFHEIKPIFPDAIDPAAQWREVDRKLSGRSDIDRAMANMIRQIEGARTPDKVRLVAKTHGMKAVLPYCDAALADYGFNLPLADRYDVKSRTDKIPLRRLLAERLDYDAEVVGDGFFAFDGASFFIANSEFVRDEIYGCDLWEPEVVSLVDGWLAALPQRPFLFHALHSLFVVSGWRNHSSYAAA